jgi:integrase
LRPSALARFNSRPILVSASDSARWAVTRCCSRSPISGSIVYVTVRGALQTGQAKARGLCHCPNRCGSYLGDNRLARNAAAGVDLPRLPTVEHRYLTHKQVAALAEEIGAYRLLVLTLAYCGLRWGEVAALKVRHVDLMRGRLTVTEAVADTNGVMVFGTPKSHQTRSVPLPRFLRGDLANHLAGKTQDDLVFTAPRGGVLRVQNFRRRYFDLAAREVGLHGLVLHELRHTAASLAISAEATVKAVQQMLGHKSASMTLDVNSGLFGDELDAVADRLDAAARDSGVPPVCPDATVTPIAQSERGPDLR